MPEPNIKFARRWPSRLAYPRPSGGERSTRRGVEGIQLSFDAIPRRIVTID